MPNVLDDLAVFINAASSAFKIGSTLNKGRIPDSPEICITLIEVLAFEPPFDTFGPSGSFNWERPQIQIVSRGGQHDYKTARDNAETVYKIVRNVYNTTTGINGTKYHYIAPRSSPHYQGEDDNSRHLITFTIDVWKEPSS